MMLLNPQSPAARWALGTFLVALLGVGACEVPTSYQVEMGKQLQLQTEVAALDVTPDRLMQSLQGVDGVDDVSVSLSHGPQGSSLLATVWGHELDADALIAALRAADPGLASATVDVKPLEGTAHGSLADRLGKTLFDIEVSGETADEIKAEIMAQLAAQGFDGDAQVEVLTDGDTRTITIDTSTDVEGAAPGETEDVMVQQH
jgi:hypothetical protein